MDIRRFIFNINRRGGAKSKQLRKVLSGIGLDWTMVGLIGLLVFIIFALSYNTYSSIERAIRGSRLLEIERQKLEEEKRKAEELELELQYFSSLEYRQRYAYDSLNLARPGERIYNIEFGDRERYEISSYNPDPIQVDDHRKWWNTVFEIVKE